MRRPMRWSGSPVASTTRTDGSCGRPLPEQWPALLSRDELTRRLGIPVYIANDADLAAVGEAAFGSGAPGTVVAFLTISTGIGAGSAYVNNAATTTQSGTIPVPRPAGTLGINRKTSLSQRDLGLLDTGEIFLNTNPGTQLEIAAYPWGTQTSGPSTLNAVVGQVVPSGQLIQGLPEV